MKKNIIAALAVVLFLCSCSADAKHVNTELLLKENSGIPSQLSDITHIKKESLNKTEPDMPDKLNFDIQKSVWISYIDLYDMLYNKTSSEFEEAFDTACKNCSGIGINTLYVHVRAFGDAFYPSKLFQFTKTAGEGCNFDPLDIMVDTAHKNGLSFHAWINPFRCESEEYISDDLSFPISNWYDTGDDRLKCLQSDEHYYLDPASEDVRKLICDGIEEIIDAYDVDGIHFDDYFYPTTDKSFDKISFSKISGKTLKEFRRDNINMLVADVYSLIKSKNKNILFGISPQGNIDNDVNKLYADVYKWCESDGYIDYIVPQIYFGFENPVLPFDECADKWQSLKKNDNISLITGLAVYKLYTDDEYMQDEQILAKQIKYAQSLEGYKGYALYNYNSLFPMEREDAKYASAQIENIQKNTDGS